MLYLLTSNYVSTLVESDHKASLTEIILACITDDKGYAYTKTPDEFEKDLDEGWVSEEEWVYMDEDGFCGWVQVQSIHELDEKERKHHIEQFGEPIMV